MSALNRLIIGITSVFALTGLFVVYQQQQKKHSLPEHIQKNQKLEKEGIDFTVYDLNTKPVSLSSLKNKVVIINFWATWCAPCVEELPALNKLAGSFPKKLVIWAVSNERTHSIKNFLMAFPDFHPNFIPASVSKSRMLSVFSVRAFPESYILDQQGKLKEKVIGSRKWNSKEWKEKIKLLIQQQYF